MRFFFISIGALFCSYSVLGQNKPYQKVDSLMRTYTKPVNDVDGLREVWYFIYKNVDADSLRLRAAVVWIADNIAYDVKGWQSENVKSGQLDYVLSQKKAVCAGYATLLKSMCDMFRIECRIVEGRARAFDRDIVLSQLKLTSNHAWNMVKINDQWRLIDPTWVSGSVTGNIDDPKASFNKEFNQAYYFLSPEKFILNHFPAQSKYQLLTPSVKEEAFRLSPLYLQNYLDGDVDLISPKEALLKISVGDTIIFRFRKSNLISEITAWSPTQKKAEYHSETITTGQFIEFRYPVTVSSYYSLYLFNTNTLRGKEIVAYKLQVEPKITR